MNKISTIDYIKSRIPYLSKKNQIIANEIIGIKQEDIGKTAIQQISKKLNISQSTIVRFCQNIGYDGFLSLKNSIISSSGKIEKVTSDNPIINNINTIIYNEYTNLSILKDLIDVNIIEKVCHTIINSSFVFLFAVGTSHPVALDLAQKLQVIGIKCALFMDKNMQILNSIDIPENAVAFCISYYAKSKTITQIIENISKSKAPSILMTSNYEIENLNLIDTIIKIPKSEDELRYGAGISRIHQLILIDIIYVNLIEIMNQNAKNSIQKSFDNLKDENSLT